MQLFLPDLVWWNGAFNQGMAVLVDSGCIKQVKPREVLLNQFPQAERIPLVGEALLPGTVNGHNHSFQSLLRGIATDKPFLTWRDEALYRYTPHMTTETIYAGALLAFGEMVRYGVTTVVDFFYVHHDSNEHAEAVIRAARDVGLRIVMARTMYDWDGAPECFRESVDGAVKRTRELAGKYQGHPFVSVHPAPHSPHGASPEMIQAGHRLAKEIGTPYHIHVAEEQFEVDEILAAHRVRPVRFLDQLGVLDDSTIAIHLVWLENDEIELLGQRRSALAYCPSSNMFLADGVTKVPELLSAGVRIMLGSDGGCSNNRCSVFEEMRMTALLQKVSRLNATAIGAKETFMMGTEAAGDILRLPIGKIAPGYRADFVGIDIRDLSVQPMTPGKLRDHIVYSMQPNAIRRVLVDGVEVVRDGVLKTIGTERIRRLVNEESERVFSG